MTTTASPQATPRTSERPDPRHERPTAHDERMLALEAERYEHGIDISDSRYL